MKIELTTEEFLELLFAEHTTYAAAPSEPLTSRDIITVAADLREDAVCGEQLLSTVGVYQCNMTPDHQGPHVFEPVGEKKN